MSWLLAFAGFAALIVLHELGHFLAAKAVGMRVERFSLFFGPMFVKFRRGETEYGIGVIPLGGYVKITGMNPEEELPPEVAPRAYYRQEPWKRIVVIAAGPAMNVLIALVLLFFLSLGHAKLVNTAEVSVVNKGSAAERVLRPGDRIVSVDGVRGDAAALRTQIGTHGCAGDAKRDGCEAAVPARVTVLRDGRQVALEVRPRYSATEKRALIGFSFGTRYEGLPAGRAATHSFDVMWEITKASVTTFGKIFVDEKARKEVSGVVGSYEATRQSIEFDAPQAIFTLALISLSLAIINLFPFLPLDGGHVFWAVAEKVRGRAISFTVLERASVFGFLLIIVIFAIGFSNDIGRLRGEGFGIR